MEATVDSLIKKYNVAAPRYTSYPTVPYWSDNLSVKDWEEHVKDSFNRTNSTEGISIYIHLPFCQSLCTYCGCNTRITTNHKVEDTYIEAVLKEWRMYRDLLGSAPRIKELHLGGGTPTFFSPSNLEKLISGILADAIVCDDPEFSFEGHPNNTTYAHLKTLHSLGFSRVSFGIQDMDPKVQEIINRVQPLENVERVTREAREIGYSSINYDLIYGLPLQTKQAIINTVNTVIQLKPGRIALYSYAHIPWIKPGQRKFTEKDLPADDAKRELYETARALLENAGYVEIGMDHFALSSDSLFKAMETGRLHRNFMGYTSSHTTLCIGLGVSAIGDTWTAFAQNLKTVEEYYDSINKGLLPVFKGHVLTEEDQIIRKHILNIMCRFETNWNNKENYTPYLAEALGSLVEMKRDGLVQVFPNGIKVTPKGRQFLRNICMAFDARLSRKVPDKQIFSKVV